MAGLAGTLSFGPYTGTWNGTDYGLCEGPKRIQISPAGRLIFADRYGDTPIDGIYRGGQCFFLVTFKEWKAASIAPMWPFGTLGNIGTPGKRHTNLAKQIVLTPVANTEAATAGPTAITLPLLLPAESNNLEILLGNEPRDIPVLFRAYPDASGNWFTYT